MATPGKLKQVNSIQKMVGGRNLIYATIFLVNFVVEEGGVINCVYTSRSVKYNCRN